MSEAPRRTPVMADVARLAGVSHQTVSRVVNGQTNLRPETRERVLRAIDQLGYRPNTAARSLVTRRSATIGVIGSRSGFWGPSTVHRAIQSAGRDAGYCRGKGGSMHMASVEKNMWGGHAIVGGHLPIAAGLALVVLATATLLVVRDDDDDLSELRARKRVCDLGYLRQLAVHERVAVAPAQDARLYPHLTIARCAQIRQDVFRVLRGVGYRIEEVAAHDDAQA